MVYDKESVRVGPSPHGMGVFALRPMSVHELIGPIQGKVIEDSEYESDYCMEMGEDFAMEPDAPFRFLNHSCHPNCALVEVIVHDTDETIHDPEIWVEILTDIETGEHLTIDYSWPAESAVPCECGSPDCRGWIVDPKERDQVPGIDKSPTK